ncbi:hypothetical protein L1887_18486 [Cichorium endivia]|nr:hypothetical protein L1887_18486 [Cichorium endivia]
MCSKLTCEAEINLEKYRIPLEEIIQATKNFSSESQIGDGGLGMVYKGQLSEHRQNRTVAIRRLNRDGYQGDDEFYNELKMVSSFQHPNIIPFIGYCDDADEMIIVYEYAVHGSLDSHLQDPNKWRCITWAQRLRICLGAAKGLKYLHSASIYNERDVTSKSILLDGILQTKIGYFGLSRSSLRNQQHTHLITKASGTTFYMNPIDNERDRLSKESDVYSFGVVLFEMSSGMPANRAKCFVDGKERYLLDLVRSYYDGHESGVFKKLIDPVIKDRIDMSSFNTFNKIAHECINLDSKKRPTMDRIIDEIEKALKIQLDHICCRDFTDEVNNVEDGFPANNDDITSTVELDTVNSIYDGLPIPSQNILSSPESNTDDDRNNDLPPSHRIRPFKKQKTYKP